MFHSLDILQLFENGHLHSAKHVVAEVVDQITIRHMYEWQMSIDKEVGTNKNSRNKLSFYRLFKRFFATESTVSSICLLHIEQHMQNLDVGWRRLK